MNRLSVFGIILVSFFSNSYAYNIGDRAIGMGGAYTALSDDASSTWYNPAGLVLVPNYMLSGSATAYQHKSITYKNFIQIEHASGKNKSDYSLNSVNVYPTTLIYAKGFGGSIKHGLAFSVLVQDSLSDHGTIKAQNKQKTHFITFETLTSYSDHYIGPSYAIGTDNLSFGVSAFVRYFDKSYTYNLYEDTSVSGQLQHISAKNFQERYNNFSFVPLVGMQYQPTNIFRIGLRGAIPSARIGGSTSVNRVITRAGSETLGGTDEHVQEHKERTIGTILKTPWRARLGLGFLLSDGLAIELSGDISGKIKSYLDRKSTLPNSSAFEQNHYAKNLGYDLNLGFEYKMSKTWALRMGGFTSFSHQANYSKSIESNANNSLAGQHYEDSFGITLGLGQTTDDGHLSYTVAFRRGTGEAVGFYTQTPDDTTLNAGDDIHSKGVRIVESSFSEITFYISGTLSDTKDRKKKKEKESAASVATD